MIDNTIKLVKCERCYGTGHADLGLCSYCRGSGHVPAPVPSDIDGPSGEADDLIERKVWRRVRDDGRVTFWETEVPDGELFVPAARLAALQASDEANLEYIEAMRSKYAALQQERDGWQRSAREWKEFMIKYKTRWEAVEAFVASLQRRVETLTDEREVALAQLRYARAQLTPPEQGGTPS